MKVAYENENAMKKCIRCYDEYAVNSAGHCVKCTAKLEAWTKKRTDRRYESRLPAPVPFRDIEAKLEKLIHPQVLDSRIDKITRGYFNSETTGEW